MATSRALLAALLACALAASCAAAKAPSVKVRKGLVTVWADPRGASSARSSEAMSPHTGLALPATPRSAGGAERAGRGRRTTGRLSIDAKAKGRPLESSFNGTATGEYYMLRPGGSYTGYGALCLGCTVQQMPGQVLCLTAGPSWCSVTTGPGQQCFGSPASCDQLSLTVATATDAVCAIFDGSAALLAFETCAIRQFAEGVLIYNFESSCLIPVDSDGQLFAPASKDSHKPPLRPL
jgi:hypothetical protein